MEKDESKLRYVAAMVLAGCGMAVATVNAVMCMLILRRPKNKEKS